MDKQSGQFGRQSLRRTTGEFYLENGKPRNLFEILGLNSDGSTSVSMDKQSGQFGRQSLLGRRGTYMVTGGPEGIPSDYDAPPGSAPVGRKPNGKMPRASDIVEEDDHDE